MKVISIIIENNEEFVRSEKWRNRGFGENTTNSRLIRQTF